MGCDSNTVGAEVHNMSPSASRGSGGLEKKISMDMQGLLPWVQDMQGLLLALALAYLLFLA